MRLFRDARVNSLVLFAALAVAHSWPLATAPAELSRNDNADTATFTPFRRQHLYFDRA
jgi:hypothetical protein